MSDSLFDKAVEVATVYANLISKIDGYAVHDANYNYANLRDAYNDAYRASREFLHDTKKSLVRQGMI